LLLPFDLPAQKSHSSSSKSSKSSSTKTVQIKQPKTSKSSSTTPRKSTVAVRDNNGRIKTQRISEE
jgi:hypothetical protein